MKLPEEHGRDLRCEHCGKKLDPSVAVWIELDNRRMIYTSEEIPEKDSQGYFPFGASCAKKIDGKNL